MSKHNTEFEYRVPYNEELVELKLKPYRTNKQLESKINYLFSHAKFIHNQLYKDVSTSGTRQLIRDMGTIAVAMMRHFLEYPAQYGHNIENIQWQIIVRMWKQTFNHAKLQLKPLDTYYGCKAKLLTVDNQWIEELYDTVTNNRYIQHNDDMVKVRQTKSTFTGKQVGLRDRVSYGCHEGGKRFNHYIDLAERYG